MIRRPPRSTLPTRRSSDLLAWVFVEWMKANASRRIILQTKDGKVLHAEGMSAKSLAKGARRTSEALGTDRKSTRLNSSHANISYAVFCLKKKTHWQYSYSL